MDALTKARRPVRREIKKLASDLIAVSKKTALTQEDRDQASFLLELMTTEYTALLSWNEKVAQQIVLDNVTDEDQDKEFDECREFNILYHQARKAGERILPRRDVSPGASTRGSGGGYRVQRRLPPVKVPPFSGEYKDWLGWWAIFKPIHDDPDVETSDKFSIVKDAMQTGRAADLVEGYPMSDANYPKLIEALENRFGKKEILIEVYVRELLSIINENTLNNAKSGKDPVNLTKLYDTLESHLRALETMGVTTEEKVTYFLYPMVESCLPIPLLRAWQRSSLKKDDSGGKTKLQRLMQFFSDEVENEAMISLATQGFVSKPEPSKDEKPRTNHHKSRKDKFQEESLPTAMGLVSLEAKGGCAFCGRKHLTQECYGAKKMTFEERMSKVMESKRCLVCLKEGHFARTCRVNVICSDCGGRHFAILCQQNFSKPDEKESIQQVLQPGPVIAANQEGTSQTSCANQLCIPDVLLPTLQVEVIGRNGKRKIVRAGVDSFSQQSYIKRSLAQNMDYLPMEKATFNHAVFGGKVNAINHFSYRVNLKSLTSSFSCSMKVFDDEEITAGLPALPSSQIIGELKEKGIRLSDTASHLEKIELLIGSDYLGKILKGNVVQLRAGGTVIETQFGWMVLGKQDICNHQSQADFVVTSLTNLNTPTAFWSLETLGIMDPVQKKSKDDQDLETLNHFRSTVARRNDGRYEVALPWIEGHPILPSNQEIAMKRLENSTRKLLKEDKINEYGAVFKEWIDMGVIEEVKSEEKKVEDSIVHYLPHRPVFKPDSATTKVRPVFDASCKPGRNAKNLADGEVSLNDCLQKGPNLLELIPNLLLRFREKPVAATADIRKAFLMIGIKDNDRDALRFLWWNDESCSSVVTYRHCRVVFGVNCSPFLLGAVIEHHVGAYQEDDATKQILLRSLYVDNLVVSFQSEDEFLKFKEKSIKMLAEAKFDLRMWESNTDKDMTSPISGLLGMQWNRKEDKLFCLYDATSFKIEKITKKSILSAIARIFDPLGMLAPVTLYAKRLMQQCWSLKLGWSDEVGGEIEKSFRKWAEELPLIPIVSIARYFGACGENKSIHIFCDASESGYAAVAFLRIEEDDDVTISFIMARSRVAPVEVATINRLELLACEVGVRLGFVIKDALAGKDITITYWTDSSTAKAWIQRNKEWGTFVGNRVKKIRSLSNPDDWKHVPGTMNPADLPSRGCIMSSLIESAWWEGPTWLKLSPSSWPDAGSDENEEEIHRESKKMAMSSLVSVQAVEWYDPKSCTVGTYDGIVRLVGWFNRFCFNCKNPYNKKTGPLSVEDLALAERMLLLSVQQHGIEKDLLKVEVYRDEIGLLRVKTRLSLRLDDETYKSPVLLPGKHYITHLLIRKEHFRNQHAGLQYLMGELREKFWIVGGRRAIEKVVNGCVICRKYTTKPPELATGPLPENRIKDADPFEVVGVDYAGPLYLRNGKKVWIALYTCAVFRAVHLELVSSLSTEAFLLSFRRFVARRGRPAVLYSDNGTNFIGASRLLRGIDFKKISSDESLKEIKWIFNPPSAPWWGGFWERLVRTVKGLLIRVLGKRILDWEELETVLCDVEAVINGRPLTYVFEGDTLVPLTPSLFIRGWRLEGVPEVDQLDMAGFQKRYRLRQKLMSDLRGRFRKEYLGLLVQKKDKVQKGVELAVGDVVLVGADNVKRISWPMGVIQEIILGKDGIGRVAKVRTAKGFLTRPIQRLFLLEAGNVEKQAEEEFPEDDPEKLEKVVRTR